MAHVGFHYLVLCVLAAVPYAWLLKGSQQWQTQWDDVINYVKNTQLQDMCSRSAEYSWMISSDNNVLGVYEPVSLFVKSCLGCWFGFHPSTFTVASLALHILNSLLVYTACVRFVKAHRNVEQSIVNSSSLLAALIFCVHPSRVEVVCWASCFPYSLSLFFLLLSIHALFSAVKSQAVPVGVAFAFVSVIMYGLAVFSKVVAIVLPCVVLIVVLARKGTLIAGTSIIPLITSLAGYSGIFFVAARAAMTAVISGEKSSTIKLSGADNVLRLFYSISVTMKNQIFPVGLNPLLPWPAQGFRSSESVVFVPVLVQSLLILICVPTFFIGLILKSGAPPLSVLYICYVAFVLPPLSGLHGFPIVTSDRYSLLPAVLLSLALALSLTDVAVCRPTMLVDSTDVVVLRHEETRGRTKSIKSKSNERRSKIGVQTRSPTQATRIVSTICWFWIGLLLLQSYLISPAWKDSVSLWRRSVALDSFNPYAIINLRNSLIEVGANASSAASNNLIRAAWNARHRSVHHNTAYVSNETVLTALRRDFDILLRAGLNHEGVECLQEAVKISPTNPRLSLSLAKLLRDMGRVDDAIDEVTRGLTHTPTDQRLRALASELRTAYSQTSSSVDANKLEEHVDEVGHIQSVKIDADENRVEPTEYSSHTSDRHLEDLTASLLADESVGTSAQQIQEQTDNALLVETEVTGHGQVPGGQVLAETETDKTENIYVEESAFTTEEGETEHILVEAETTTMEVMDETANIAGDETEPESDHEALHRPEATAVDESLATGGMADNLPLASIGTEDNLHEPLQAAATLPSESNEETEFYQPSAALTTECETEANAEQSIVKEIEATGEFPVGRAPFDAKEIPMPETDDEPVKQVPRSYTTDLQDMTVLVQEGKESLQSDPPLNAMDVEVQIEVTADGLQ